MALDPTATQATAAATMERRLGDTEATLGRPWGDGGAMVGRAFQTFPGHSRDASGRFRDAYGRYRDNLGALPEAPGA